jgi:DNA-directed RNA polymerase subunit RPC12/RpoP
MCKKANVDFVDGVLTVQPFENEVDNSLIQCTQCGEKFNVNDENVIHMLTHPLVKCTKCGKEFTEEELDENHVCAICRVKEMDAGFSQLENADPFTLMRMLAQVRIDNLNLTKTNEQIQKRLERAEETEQENSNQPEEAPKKKRGGRKKKATEPVQTEEDVINIDEKNVQGDSDIEISEDVAPDLPTEVTAMSDEMNAETEG